MKKKFVNGLLMAALFVGFTSSMVSCKDYDDEKITNLEGVLADNVDNLQKQIDALKTLQQTCQQNCQTFQTNITNQLKLYVLQEDFIKILKDSLNNYYTKAEVDAKLNDVYAKFGDYYTKAEIDAKFTEVKNMFNDYYKKGEVDAAIASLRTAMLDSIKEATSDAAVAATVARLLNNGNVVLTTAVDAYIKGYNERNGIIDKDSIDKLILVVSNRVDEVRAIAVAAQDLAKANKFSIDSLGTVVTELGNSVKTLQDDLAETNKELAKVATTANNALALAERDSILIAELQTNYNNLSQKVDDNYAELKGFIDENTSKITALETTVNNFMAEAERIHGELDTKISNVDTDLQSFKVTVAEFALAVQETFKEIAEFLAVVADYMDKNITSIEINGTYNPMFGELALPFNIRSGMLVAFRGTTSDRGLQFPTRNADYAALPDTWNGGVFTEKDLEMLGISNLSQVKGRVVIGENEDIVATQYADENGDVQVKSGNAGTIYLTVNPTNRDFTGTEFTLINSNNNEVAAELSPLKKSDHLLTFGYTRAAVEEESPNGFYETQVTVNAEDAKNMGLRLDLDKIKDVAKNLQEWKQGVDLTTLMNAVYNNINDVLDASAVKATWKVGEGEDEATFSAVSQYAIGVAGVKPLSFGFAKDIVLDGIPGTDLAEDLLHNIIDVVVEGLPDMDFINRLEIEELYLDELTDDLYATIKFRLGTRYIESTGPKTATFWFPYYEITGTNGEYVLMTNTHPEVTVTMSGGGDEDGYATISVKLYMGDFIDRMGDYDSENYDNIKDQFNHLLDHANDFISTITQLNFTSMGNDIFKQFKDFIDQLNLSFSRFTRPNRFFKPAIIVKNAEGMVHLSTLANYPTKVEGPFVIIPSNYNAEILSPAFKKFIAVTDVRKDGNSAQEGNTECLNELKAANKTLGFNEVIDGGFNPMAFNGKSGYSYTFIYSAVDYSGKVVTKKFYLTVK